MGGAVPFSRLRCIYLNQLLPGDPPYKLAYSRVDEAEQVLWVYRLTPPDILKQIMADAVRDYPARETQLPVVAQNPLPDELVTSRP